MTLSSLVFRNRDHDPFTGWLEINNILHEVIHGALVVALAVGNAIWEFESIDGARINRDFYLASLDATGCVTPAGTACANEPGVPIPAPFILMGTVLAGAYLVGRLRRRRDQVPATAAE